MFQGAEFLSPNGGLEYVIVGPARLPTLILTSTTVINKGASRYTRSLVGGDLEGIHRCEIRNIGLPEHYRLENGRVLTLDAGENCFL